MNRTQRGRVLVEKTNTGARTVCNIARDSTGASGKQEKKG